MAGKKTGLDRQQLQDPELGRVLWQLDSLRFDERSRELLVAGQPVALEPRPAELLMVLLRQPNTLVSKDDLFRIVWRDRPVTESVLTKAMAKLRAALGHGGGLIQTVHGFGYRLNGLPQVLAAAAEASLAICRGMPLPGREGWRLHQALSRPELPGSWWSARHADQSEWLVCIADEQFRPDDLRREFALHRQLGHGHGLAAGVIEPITDCHLASQPAYLAWKLSATSDLPTWLANSPNKAPIDYAERLELVRALCRASSEWQESGGISPRGLRPWHFVVRGKSGEAPVASLIHLARQPDDDQYTPPEAPHGGDAPSQRGDVYSLGLLAYKLLVGDLHARLAPGWERLLPDPLLAEDISAATQLAPERRLASARQLLERLEALESRRRSKAELEGAQRALQAEQVKSRRWRWALLWSVLASTMVCGALGGGLYTTAKQRSESTAPVTLKSADPIGAAIWQR